MKKFHFSLERMLKYKNTLLDREKDALHALHAQRQSLEQNIADTEAQLLAQDKASKEDAARTTTAAQLQRHSFTIENTRKLLKQLRHDLAQMQILIQQQTAVVLGMSQEVSGLEKLEDKQRQEYDYAANSEEAERILEIVSGKYIAAQPR